MSVAEKQLLFVKGLSCEESVPVKADTICFSHTQTPLKGGRCIFLDHQHSAVQANLLQQLPQQFFLSATRVRTGSCRERRNGQNLRLPPVRFSAQSLPSSSMGIGSGLGKGLWEPACEQPRSHGNQTCD